MDVTIDDDFARFGAKSYAINKINSVEVRERQPHGKSGAIICAVIAVFGLMAGIGSFSSPEGASFGGFGVAVIFGAIAYALWKKSEIREYQLFLMTSSSEAQALVSFDSAYVQDLRDQIEGAMLHHSRRGSDR